MKKQITILIPLLLHLFSFAQNGIVKMTTPCTDEFVQNVQGRWLDGGAGLDPNLKISKQQQQEISNRVNKIHQFVFDIYPSPVGFDAGHDWHTSHEQFAYQVKLEDLANGNTMESRINGIPIILYWYDAYFGRYSCAYNDKYKMLRGLPSDDVEGFSVYANKLTLLEEGAPYEMNIEGRKIEMMPVVKGTWKGYTLYTPVTGSGKTMVVLHRDGMLPYIPVTRKQYLDLSISYLNKMFDKLIADIDKDAKTFIDAGMADPQTLKKNKENYQKQKKDVLKHYNDELAATTAAGLLDVPAVIPLAICDPDVTRAIFTTEAAGGRLLVTENPGYIRRDLPKYIPQLLVLTFEEASWTPTQKKDPLKLVEKNFPVEQLQAMIDK
jgi:hypothetical protein